MKHNIVKLSLSAVGLVIATFTFCIAFGCSSVTPETRNTVIVGISSGSNTVSIFFSDYQSASNSAKTSTRTTVPLLK
jgi:hypothetical protein